MIRFQFYGIQTVFFQGKNSKNVSKLGSQNFISHDDELILKGFKEAGIYEVINDAQEIFERVENPFRA